METKFVHDISRALATEGESVSPATIALILKQDGFCSRRRLTMSDQIDHALPVIADMADVRRSIFVTFAPVRRLFRSCHLISAG